ncbi:hypothetical protein EYC84_000377 [Monilinia fructicola]|uniref:Uncharacterized protein n=1 Tax=Monilinia fructicola TaxID=38448 RepID=A0A5M9JSG5_MONFR|nr:hypothetical protein EYC84_000377 [Monilinia fructicola]
MHHLSKLILLFVFKPFGLHYTSAAIVSTGSGGGSMPVVQASSIPNAINPNDHGNKRFRRDDVVHRVNFMCPEVLGAPPMACNSSRCGGADPNNNGTCYYEQGDGPKCQCTTGSNSTSTPTLTTITTTQVGQSSGQSLPQTVTATFALESIPLYSDLRQNFTSTIVTNITSTIVTTLTTTISNTISVGMSATYETSVETGVAIILAGGVFWSLFGYVGDAAIIATMDPPVDAPNHPDDTTCPEPKQACSSPNCAGILEMCSNINDPTHGCACDENSTCEETEIDCGDPACSGWAAAQYDDTNGPSASGSFRDWCSRMDGKTLGKTDSNDTIYQMYHFAYYSYWLSAQYWYSSPSEDECTETAVISKDECITAFSTGMSACDPNSGDTHGFSFPGMCINYNVSISTSTNPKYPPWEPLPPSDEPGCVDSISNVDSNFFKGIYPQFCSAFTSNQDSNFTKVLTNANFVNPSKKRETPLGSFFTLRTPPASSEEYPNYKLTFKWSGNSGGSRNGGEQNKMASSGSVSVGCGRYEYEITPPVSVPATCNPENAVGAGLMKSASPSAMSAAADQFCNFGYNWKINGPLSNGNWQASDYFLINDRCTDPRTSLACICDGASNDLAQMSDQWKASRKECAKPENHVAGAFNSNNRVGLRVTPSVNQTGCKPLEPYVLPYGSHCTLKFGYVTSACSIQAYSKGWGGYYTENSEHGCYDWWIYGQNVVRGP